MKNKTQQIIVANDLPGAAKVAGASNIPILAAAQFEACILPTLILSTHTLNYPGLVKHYLNEDFKNILNHWDEIELDAAACLTGYFADTSQIDDIADYLEKNPTRLYVDPTMAEAGQLYGGFDETFPVKIRRLVKMADVLLPNVTEACFITDTEYKEEFSMDEYIELVQKLIDLGAKSVVLSGINTGDDQIGYLIQEGNNEPTTVMHDKLPHNIKGTGDLTASLITAYNMVGLSLEESVKRTIPHTVNALENTINKAGRESKLGIYFESIIPEFAAEINELRK